MALIIYLLDEITNELRALMFTKFCGYERIQVDIEYGCMSHDYRISVRSLVTDMKKQLWFDADYIKDRNFRRNDYYYQLGLNWADPVC